MRRATVRLRPMQSERAFEAGYEIAGWAWRWSGRNILVSAQQLAFEPRDSIVEIFARDNQSGHILSELLGDHRVGRCGKAQPMRFFFARMTGQLPVQDRALGEQPGNDMHKPRCRLERLTGEVDPAPI